LLGRLAVATEQGGAWQRTGDGRALGDKDKIALRGQLEWDPSDALNFRLGVHLSQDKSDEQGCTCCRRIRRPAGGDHTADSSRYVTGWSLNPTSQKSSASPRIPSPGSTIRTTASIDGELRFRRREAHRHHGVHKLIRREYGDWMRRSTTIRTNTSGATWTCSRRSCASLRRRRALRMGGGRFLLERGSEGRFLFGFHRPPRGIALTQYEQKANSVGVFGQVNYQFTTCSREPSAYARTRDAGTDRIEHRISGAVDSILHGGALGGSTTSNLPSARRNSTISRRPTRCCIGASAAASSPADSRRTTP